MFAKHFVFTDAFPAASKAPKPVLVERGEYGQILEKYPVLAWSTGITPLSLYWSCLSHGYYTLVPVLFLPDTRLCFGSLTLYRPCLIYGCTLHPLSLLSSTHILRSCVHRFPSSSRCCPSFPSSNAYDLYHHSFILPIMLCLSLSLNPLPAALRRPS